MQQVKRTFAHVSTLLRDIKREGVVSPDLDRRIDEVTKMVTLCGNYIIEREYPPWEMIGRDRPL